MAQGQGQGRDALRRGFLHRRIRDLDVLKVFLPNGLDRPPIYPSSQPTLRKDRDRGTRTDSAHDAPEAEAGERVLHEVGLAGADEGRALPEFPVVVRGSLNPAIAKCGLAVLLGKSVVGGHRRIRHFGRSGGGGFSGYVS